MMVPSDAVFRTEQFWHDFMAHHNRHPLSPNQLSVEVMVEAKTARRWLRGPCSLTLHQMIRFAMHADLSIDKYAMTLDEQREWQRTKMHRQLGLVLDMRSGKLV